MELPPAEAIVVGAGPNGLAAAIALAQQGVRVVVVEAAEQPGGGARSAELTLPGFTHDICSAVHPLAAGSPFFTALPLAEHGLEWVQPDAPLAHPFDDGSALVVERSLAATAAKLGADARAYEKLLGPMVEDWKRMLPALLAPLRVPRHPLAMAAFGMQALRPARSLARSVFRTEAARALFAGTAGHAMVPLEKAATSGFGLVLLAAAHAVGWPVPRGGAQKISDALASYLRSLGGQIVTGARVDALDELPPARAVLCDLTVREFLRVARSRLPLAYQRKLSTYRFGLAAFKVDWALDGPIPWRAEECRRAGTLHLGGSLDEIAASETAAWHGGTAARPFLILAQPTLFDRTRAPAGKHVAWGYCHVPNGSREEMLERLEMQIERYAPGFRKLVLARHVMTPAQFEAHNPNLAGGDINGGAADLPQLFRRPTWSYYATPARGVYLCSSSTPPGGGVHGMCGYFAAQLALRREF